MGWMGGLAQHGSGEMEGNLSVACVDQATYDKLKVNNTVLFDQATYDKLLTEVPKYKQITPSVLSERLRINGSLARRAIKDLIERGLIRMVSIHSSQQIPKYKQIALRPL